MQSLANVISVQSDVQFGKPVFKGTRVPVQGLFWHLEKGITLDEFLADFPSVSRKQVEVIIEWAAQRFADPQIIANENSFG